MVRKMKIKLKKKEATNIIMYIVVLIGYLFCIDIIGMSDVGILDNLRYVLFAVAIAVGIFVLIKRNKVSIFDIGKKQLGAEIKDIFFVVIIFFALSIVQASKVGHVIGQRTYIQLALILIPALYSYILVNTLSVGSLEKLFSLTLWIGIIFYVFLEIGIETFLVPSNYLAIDFLHSDSPFESSSTPDIFLCCFMFFYFYRNSANSESKEYKKRTKNMYISLFFVFLSFKRLAVLFCLVMMIFNKFINIKGKMPKWTALATAIFFSLVVPIYTKFMQGQAMFGIDVFEFSKGRDYILGLWAAHNYLSYGYGSSMEIIGRYLEMDLVQIYLEIGLIAIFIFTYIYFKIARTSLFAYLFMLYEFFNMLTSSSIPSPLGWTLVLVIIASVASKKTEIEGGSISQRNRIKFLWKRG